MFSPAGLPGHYGYMTSIITNQQNNMKLFCDDDSEWSTGWVNLMQCNKMFGSAYFGKLYLSVSLQV